MYSSLYSKQSVEYLKNEGPMQGTYLINCLTSTFKNVTEYAPHMEPALDWIVHMFNTVSAKLPYSSVTIVTVVNKAASPQNNSSEK